eukprot:3991414-Amphidinium_carterae.1
MDPAERPMPCVPSCVHHQGHWKPTFMNELMPLALLLKHDGQSASIHYNVAKVIKAISPHCSNVCHNCAI